MAQSNEVGRVALRWSYSSIKQPSVDLERLKDKLNEIKNRDVGMFSLLPPTRVPLIKIQPVVGGYKAYSKEHSSEAQFKSPLNSVGNSIGFNRKLVKSFRSGATLRPINPIDQKTPASQPQRRANSMALMDDTFNATPQPEVMNPQEKIATRKKKVSRQSISDFLEIYGQLPRLNSKLQTKILEISSKINTGVGLPHHDSHRKLPHFPSAD